MHVAIIGMGKMGSAVAHRLLDTGHTVSAWNRTPGRIDQLLQRGVRELPSPDLGDESIEGVLVCLADDRSLLEVAAPQGKCRPSWKRTLVASSATVSPAALAKLNDLYGDRFVAAPIVGAPHAVRSGTATFIIGGGSAARSGFTPVWDQFEGPWDVGNDPHRASVVKLLHNNLLLSELAVVAETVRVGRLAGVDDTTLKAMLEETPMLPAGLRNRLDSLFDPAHPGWFTSPLAAKDLGLVLGLAPDGTRLPVTQAARESYLLAEREGWDQADITAVVEL
ncbi:NAD(P)-dependent oxidoreductase [Amycolatopsis pigmentata]|uniref:NAD(P)-dependent oxidoreductase n=1 Tax=Amycolatopsis pigmentata TaxID=450801 RepID=A0ABW5FIU4_9PSEU